jgi:hypothetical protein
MRRTLRRARRLTSPVLAALTALTAAACASAAYHPTPVDTGAHALIYGHIDAPQPVQAVQLAKMLSPRRPSAHVLPNGDFFFEDVAPGDYGLMRFMSGGKWYYTLTGDKENNRRFIVKATPGGIHYVGAWKVTGEKNNHFSPDEFSIERMTAPGERALLQRLRPALVGTGWERKVAATRADDAASSAARRKSAE